MFCKKLCKNNYIVIRKIWTKISKNRKYIHKSKEPFTVHISNWIYLCQFKFIPRPPRLGAPVTKILLLLSVRDCYLQSNETNVWYTGREAMPGRWFHSFKEIVLRRDGGSWVKKEVYSKSNLLLLLTESQNLRLWWIHFFFYKQLHFASRVRSCLTITTILR